MNKFFILIFFISSYGFSHDHNPGNSSYQSLNLSYKAFINSDDHTDHVLISTSKIYNQKNSTLKLGRYFKFQNSSQLGLFYSLSSGTRHTDDWIIKDKEWIWENTEKRYESIIHLSYSKKSKIISHLPLVFEFSTEFQQSFLNHNQSFILSPKFHYFWINQGVLDYSTHISFSFYRSLNFDHHDFFKKSLYLKLLKHFSKNFQLGFNLSFYQEDWPDSKDSKRLRPTQKYKVTDSISLFGIEFIQQF